MSANRKLLDRYVERYNAGDLDGVMDLYAEDAVQNMPDGTFEGRDAIRERLAQELDAFPDVNHTVRSFVEQGDAFCDEWTFVGNAHGFAPAAGRHRAASHRQAGRGQGHGGRAGGATGRSPSTPCTTTTCPSLAQLGLVPRARPRDAGVSSGLVATAVTAART